MRVQKFTPLALLKILESLPRHSRQTKQTIIEARDCWVSGNKIPTNGVSINIYDDIDGEALVVETADFKYRIYKSDVTLEHLI
jgi:hypothetical protein